MANDETTMREQCQKRKAGKPQFQEGKKSGLAVRRVQTAPFRLLLRLRERFQP